MAGGGTVVLRHERLLAENGFSLEEGYYNDNLIVNIYALGADYPAAGAGGDTVGGPESGFRAARVRPAA